MILHEAETGAIGYVIVSRKVDSTFHTTENCFAISKQDSPVKQPSSKLKRNPHFNRQTLVQIMSNYFKICEK